MDESIQRLDLALQRVQQRRARRRRVIRWGSILAVFFLALALFQSFIGIRRVDGHSMQPTLNHGDLLFFVNWGQEPQYGQVVLLETEEGTLAVKRVVGLPGDRIQVTPHGRLTRNGQEVSEPYASYAIQDNSAWVTFPYVVPEDTVFCMGDYRGLSLDSRVWGGVPREQLRGTVVFSMRFGEFG